MLPAAREGKDMFNEGLTRDASAVRIAGRAIELPDRPAGQKKSRDKAALRS